MTDEKGNDDHGAEEPRDQQPAKGAGTAEAKDTSEAAKDRGGATAQTAAAGTADVSSAQDSTDQTKASKSARDETHETAEPVKQSGRAGSSDGGGTSGGSGDDKPRKGGKAAVIVAIIAFLIAILALVISGWLWYQSQHRRTNLDARLNTLQATMEANVHDMVAPKLADIRQRISQVASHNKQQSQTLSSLHSEIKELKSELHETQVQIAGMLEKLQGNARRWQLKQVEQLLVTANRRLQLFKAPAQAKTALKLASKAISRLNDPRLLKVRKRIIDSIAALNALPSPDIEGIALTLTSFIKQVPDLPLASDVPNNYTPQLPTQNGENKAAKEPSGINWTGGWQHFVDSVRTALQSMVTIRRTNGAHPVLMPAKKVYFLSQNLMLELRSARLALLEGNSTLYRTSLSTAIKWLKQYYNTDDPAVSSMIDQLHQMKSIKLEWQAPDISGSLIALRHYMQARSQDDGGPTKADALSASGQQG